MASTPSSRIKPTPSNSPFPPRPSRPAARPRPLYDSHLSLQRVIGTTCSSPTGFDTVHSSFAYIAGGAVVVVDVSGEHYSQRFYRARPNATPLLSVPPTTHTSSTPNSTPKANDSRNRALPSPRDSTHGPSDWAESPTSKTWTSRERIKAATCLALSRDARYLAVGETGYAPRVLVFNLQDASSDIPLVAISEHTFGVKAVAWSPDTRYLASLGTANDGFLYVWKADPRTGAVRLFQQNRCTSFVKHMVWMGNSLVTLGVRHVKVWRVDDGPEVSPTKQKFPSDGPAPASQPQTLKPLQGRNVLLGSMLDATFSCALPVSEENVIICSEMGAVCVLESDDTSKQIKLAKVLELGFQISCISSRGENVYIGGKDGQFAFMTLDSILAGAPEPAIRSAPVTPGLTAMGFLVENLVTIDHKRSIDVWSAKRVPAIPEDDGSHIPIPGPGDPIVGIQRLYASNTLNASFFTWSGSGRVNIWDLDGIIRSSFNIPIEQTEVSTEADAVNQVVVARATSDGSLFIVGDKLGVLRVIEAHSGECLLETKAHSSNCQDIALYEGESRFLVASCGRDRTVQLFRRSSDGDFEHFQTLEFSSRVVQVLIPAEDRVLTCSLDRTLQIHDLVSKDEDPDAMAAIPHKVVSLRASPSSMAITPDNKTIFVSLLDRSVCQYDLSSGRLLSSFKCNDEAGLDSVVLESLTYGHLGSDDVPFLAGISNTDKSVRVYDVQSGAFMDREWGHTEAINGVILMDGDENDNSRKVVSAGEDGTIMIWALGLQEPMTAGGAPQARDPSPDKTPVLASSRPPLRRVLSKAELAEFQRSSQTPSSSSTTPGRRPSPPRSSSHRRPSKFHTLPLSSLRTPVAAEKQHQHHSPPSSTTPATTPNATTAIIVDEPDQSTPSRRGSSGGNSGSGSRSDTNSSPPPPESPKLRPPSSAATMRKSRRPSLPALAVTPVSGPGNGGRKSRKNSSSSIRGGTPGGGVNGGGAGTGGNGSGNGGGGNGNGNGNGSGNGPGYGFGSLGMATEQTCRQLRAYRKKLAAAASASAESVGAEVLAQLEQELRLTIAMVEERRGGESAAGTPGGGGNSNGGTIRNRKGRGSRNRDGGRDREQDRNRDGETETEPDMGIEPMGLGLDVPNHRHGHAHHHHHHHHGKTVSESLLSDLLDQYSERLVSMLDEKLRLRMGGGGSEDAMAGAEAPAGGNATRTTTKTANTRKSNRNTTTTTTTSIRGKGGGKEMAMLGRQRKRERERSADCDCDRHPGGDFRERDRDSERPGTAGENSDIGVTSASGESSTCCDGVLCEEPESV
ncbi:hypothetical protein VTK26DRAFT_371 [Humicola hyalothermophila]